MIDNHANMTHKCPTCKSAQYDNHLGLYQHMVRNHSMRVNISCYSTCSYLKLEAPKPKRVRAKK